MMKLVDTCGFKLIQCVKNTKLKYSFKNYKYYIDNDNIADLGYENRVFPVFINLKYRRVRYKAVYYKSKHMQLREIRPLDDIFYILNRYSIPDRAQSFSTCPRRKNEFSSFKDAKQFRKLENKYIHGKD